jgi:23S rRNA (cytosine1962-C5)-methyltransferase
MENVEFREANVFDALREMEATGDRFDTIVLDPPLFAAKQGQPEAGATWVQRNQPAHTKTLNPGGV